MAITKGIATRNLVARELFLSTLEQLENVFCPGSITNKLVHQMTVMILRPKSASKSVILQVNLTL